jgi:hypothetical protein
MIEFYSNKKEIENKNICLSFIKINNFDELICSDLNKIIYIVDTKNEYPIQGIMSQKIIKKKEFFSKSIYFKLNDILLEPTKVFRDNFNNCGYIFYKMKIKETKK